MKYDERRELDREDLEKVRTVLREEGDEAAYKTATFIPHESAQWMVVELLRQELKNPA